MSICNALVILTLLTPAFASDISGKWSGSSQDSSGPGNVYAILKQDGTNLSGSAGPSESHQFPITTGKVDGDHVTFDVKMRGGMIRFDVTGGMSELKGTMRIDENGGHTAHSSVILKRVMKEAPLPQ